uniref:Capsid protein n=1 Tax=Rhizopus microsporus ambigui-like virus 1 TaxID=3156528 RepID=A0AAT9H837_9VIRU
MTHKRKYTSHGVPSTRGVRRSRTAMNNLRKDIETQTEVSVSAPSVEAAKVREEMASPLLDLKVTGSLAVWQGRRIEVERDGSRISMRTYRVLTSANVRRPWTVVPALYYHLATYALFRKRTVDLLLGLKSRGMLWCKQHNIDDVLTYEILVPAVALAMRCTSDESAAISELKSNHTLAAVKSVNPLATGELPLGSHLNIYQWMQGSITLSEYLDSVLGKGMTWSEYARSWFGVAQHHLPVN